MTNPRFEALARRRVDDLRRQLAAEIVRLREDAGLSSRALADLAGLDHSYLSRIEAAAGHPTAGIYVRISAALGADFSAHLYPTTGPLIHDRHQAAVVENLSALLHPRWRTFLEVAVRRPSRGWIDLVLYDERAGLLVASEVESALRRLEQLIRWSKDKADALPSWDGWSRLEGPTATSQLLIVRRTRANVAIVRQFERQVRVAWPAHPDDALGALTGTRPWPGAALVWAVVSGPRVRFLSTRA